MEGINYDMLQKLLFLRDYWTKSDGAFTEMQTISHSFIILKAYLDWWTSLKAIDAESLIEKFWGIISKFILIEQIYMYTSFGEMCFCFGLVLMKKRMCNTN